MQCSGGLSHGVYRDIGVLHSTQHPIGEVSMPNSHISVPQGANTIQNHPQGLSSRKTSPEYVMLGAGTGHGGNSVEVLPVQLFPKLCRNHGVSTEMQYPSVDCNNQFHSPTLPKDVNEVPVTCLRNSAPVQSNPSVVNLLGQFRNKRGERLSDVHYPNGNCPQRQKVLVNGNIPQSVQVHRCPGSSILHRAVSATDPSIDAFEAAQLGFPHEFVDEKTTPGNEKIGNSLNRSEGAKGRWKPNAVQKCLLEQHFNSGYTKPTPELHASVQGSGEATEGQVTVWLKNRASRRKKPPVKNLNAKLYENESDGDNPWEDFKQISSSILQELRSVVSAVNRTDVMVLASAIKEAQSICCYGIGQEAFTMKAFASNLHHLGFNCFYAGDTNTPALDKTGLALVSLGICNHKRVVAFIEEAIEAGAKVIAFTGQKSEGLPCACHIVHVPIHSHMHVGVDGEVMSNVPESFSGDLDLPTLFDRSLEIMIECVSIMLRNSIGVTPAEMRARHTNLE